MTFKQITFLIVVLILSATINGCGCDCDSEKDEVRSKYGNPEEVNTYSSSGYESETWWYWRKGISFTFTYTSSKGCEKSTYTFTPIQDISQREKAKREKKLVGVEISTDCLTCP